MADGDGSGPGPGRGALGRGMLFKQAILAQQQARNPDVTQQAVGAGRAAAAEVSSPVGASSIPSPPQPSGRASVLLRIASLNLAGRGSPPATRETSLAVADPGVPPIAVGRSIPVDRASISGPPSRPGIYPEPQTERLPVPASVPQKVQPENIGTDGDRVELTANYIPIKLRSTSHLYEYAVLYEPEVDSRNIRFKLLGQQSEVLGGVRVFDGSKLFLPKLLPEKITRLDGKHPASGSPVTVIVKFVTERDFKDCYHLFNILFKRVMKCLSLTEVGRHSYDPKSAIAVPQHKLEIWPGFITAINEYKGGLMLQADVSHRVLRMQTVLELMDEVRRHRPNFMDILSKQLIGLVVLTRYNNATYRIDDIAWNKTPKSTFQTSRGEEISFMQYYQNHYNLKISNDQQPLLLHKAKPRRIDGAKPDKNAEPQILCLIPELSYLTGLTDDIRSDFRVMKDLSNHTRVNPTERQGSLKTFINNVNTNTEAKNILGSWGLYFEGDTLRLTGRVMRAEKILMRHNSCNVNNEADWTKFATQNNVLNSMDLTDWEVVFCSRDEAKADDFIKLMANVCPSLGMVVNRPGKTRLRDDRTDTLVHCLKDILTGKRKVQLITVINPFMRTDRYSAIKKLCCCDMPIPTQVINANTLSKPQRNRSIVIKIALQINCKLGGELWSLDIPLKNLMVCGFDSYHDPARGNMSVLGFVSSINNKITKWFNHTCIQTKGQEIGDSLTMCLSRALHKYHFLNHSLPDKIVIYRDGVGDGQLKTVEEYEVPQFQKAFASFQNYQPTLTVIVVQKRINTRLMAVVPGRFENPTPGTIVDHTITKKACYDFYLVSQFSRQGTVFPTHYVVVHNSSSLKPDHVQRLTYKMTHLYYNWPGTIRVPAVCQYAHRLAYLVGQNLHQIPSDKLSDRLFFL